MMPHVGPMIRQYNIFLSLIVGQVIGISIHSRFKFLEENSV